MRNLEDRANRFHAGFDGSGADGDSFRTDCRFQQQSLRHNGGTKAHNSNCESGPGNNDFAKHHIAEYAVARQYRESNSANCYSCAADGFTDARHCFSNSKCNNHPGNSRDNR